MVKFMKLEDFVETCDRFDPPVFIFDDDAIDEVVLYEGLIYDIKDPKLLNAEVVGWGADSTSMEIGVSFRRR